MQRGFEKWINLLKGSSLFFRWPINIGRVVRFLDYALNHEQISGVQAMARILCIWILNIQVLDSKQMFGFQVINFKSDKNVLDQRSAIQILSRVKFWCNCLWDIIGFLMVIPRIDVCSIYCNYRHLCSTHRRSNEGFNMKIAVK